MSEIATQRAFIESTSPDLPTTLESALERSSSLIKSQQFPDGYWWYTLEANESINAERIFLNRYLGIEDKRLEDGLSEQIASSQRPDGSWALYHGGTGDLSTTIECYFAVKLVYGSVIAIEARQSPVLPREIATSPMAPRNNSLLGCLEKARAFILTHGGLSKCRVFTRIHLALFGLVPWYICPAMPPWLILLPSWFPVNVYEFSSWARASIIPLLVIQAKKRTRRLPTDFLDELYCESDPKDVDWSFPVERFFSIGNFFVMLNQVLQALEKSGIRFFEKKALKACEDWIRRHVNRTEDIYPALAYGAMALHALGYPVTDSTIQKCLGALDRFRISFLKELPEMPQTVIARSEATKQSSGNQLDCHAPSGLAMTTYQQCCISPVWDAPWAGVALLEAGMPPDSPEILKCARWLISRQIREARGDWAIKNKKGIPGGWSFEFENDFFPDVDDTIQVVDFLERSSLPKEEKSEAINRGLAWLLSMQSRNGGWGAFDIDNTKEFLNRIPFADHGACLDPPTPDITARAVGLLGEMLKISSPLMGEGQGEGGASRDHPPLHPLPSREGKRGMKQAIKRGIRLIEQTQEPWGGWWGRWGVNTVYGTWCVLDGLARAGYPMNSPRIRRAVDWLKSVQNRDGGFGESCESYLKKEFVPLTESVPSQTAWGLMALVAAGEAKSLHAERAAAFLAEKQESDGSWDEPHHTGTGFPGHFYIRYHGYRYYFPLLALARFTSSLR